MQRAAYFISKPLDLGPDCTFADCCLFLIKYPKNTTQLRFSDDILSSRKFLIRLKKLKRIQSLYSIKRRRSYTKRLREVFKYQRPSIKEIAGLNNLLVPAFPNLSSYTLNFPDISQILAFKTLCQIRQLTVNLQDQDIPLDDDSLSEYKKWKRRFWLHVYSLKHLQNLRIDCNEYGKMTLDLLLDLNNFSEILKSLRGFALNISFKNSHMISAQDFNYQNILRYVTKIELYDTMVPASHYLLDQTSRCSNLKSLGVQNIKFGKLSDYLKGYNVSLNFEPFPSLTSLTQLRLLDITVMLMSSDNFMRFLDVFKLPNSIESVRLVLQKVKWSYVLGENYQINLNVNPFEDHPRCVEFYNKWQDLPNLSSLAFRFELTETEQPIPTAYFVLPILKRLSKLTALDYANCLTWDTSIIGPLNLQDFWSSIEHLKPYLETVWIDEKVISFKDFQGGEEGWPRLKDLIIGGVIHDPGFSHLINLFRRENGMGNMSCCLSLKDLMVQNDEEFKDCLKALAKKPDHLFVKLYINVDKVSVQAILARLYKCMAKISPNSTVVLTLQNAKRIEANELLKLDDLITKKKGFKNLKIMMKNPFLIYDYEKRMKDKFKKLLYQDIGEN